MICTSHFRTLSGCYYTFFSATAEIKQLSNITLVSTYRAKNALPMDSPEVLQGGIASRQNISFLSEWIIRISFSCLPQELLYSLSIQMLSGDLITYEQTDSKGSLLKIHSFFLLLLLKTERRKYKGGEEETSQNCRHSNNDLVQKMVGVSQFFFL